MEHSNPKQFGAWRAGGRNASILLWAIAAFLILFVVWAAFAELDRTVRGTGRVVPDSRLQIVSNLEGGVVSEILVRLGDQVKRGQLLMRLDPVRTASALNSSTAQTGALAAKVARLEAEVAGRTPAYPAPQSPSDAEQIRIEQALHAARMAELSSLEAAGQARLSAAQRAVVEAQANLAARASARDAAQSELNLIRPLVERGIEPRVTLVQLEGRAATSASDAAAAAAALSRAAAGVAEARAAIAQARQDWRSQAGTELTATRAEYLARNEQLPALSDAMARTAIVAPRAGKVNRVLVTTVGAAVSPGAPLVEIVPQDERLLVEAQVRPEDIAFVAIDQRAHISLTAYDSAVYGKLEGRVVTIAPDAVVEERTGTSHYIVTIAADSPSLKARDGRTYPIGPGMTASVELLGDKRSVLNYILSPFTRLSERALRDK